MGTPVSQQRPTLWTVGTKGDDRPDLCPRCRSTCGYLVRYKGASPSAGYDLVECGCRKGEHRDLLARKARGQAGLDDAMVGQTFDNFTPADGTQQGFDAARKFAANPKGFLTLGGGTGLGKTHLLAAIANTLLAPGDGDAGGPDDGPGRLVPVYCVAPRLIGRFMVGNSGGAYGVRTEAQRYFDSLLDAGVLLLDDLGAERDTSFAQERIFDLVDWRYANRRPTAIATNSSADQLPDRLRSRLLDRHVAVAVGMKGADYRRQK
jgi:DNA replication protein DnaC